MSADSFLAPDQRQTAALERIADALERLAAITTSDTPQQPPADFWGGRPYTGTVTANQAPDGAYPARRHFRYPTARITWAGPGEPDEPLEGDTWLTDSAVYTYRNGQWTSP